MFASFRRYRLKSGRPANFAQIVQDGFVPIVSSTPGFVAYYFAVDDADNGISVSVFDDRAGAEESNRRAAEWVKSNVADFTAGPPDIVAGEVAAYKR